ncbi:MAG: SIMPL domain-containing protein, partial [Dehalococcoidales bacterium]|nr:SIMPL domain-containing protein [Dehalococcoidales bacterium]
MKRILCLAVGLLLVIIAIGATGCDSLSPPSRTSSGEAVSSQANGIWVTGTGEVTVTPDIAVLQVGVEAQEDTVAEAMDRASEAMAKVGTALADSGIESKDIQTQYFNIRQRTSWDNRTDEEIITGYRVTNKVIVKIRVLPVDSYTLDY